MELAVYHCWYLKSSMDRFIEGAGKTIGLVYDYLKSSMDRFIVLPKLTNAPVFLYLKSSMDRFIAVGQKLK